jgi:uncharacterized radical SAM superfamily Fe-S cluster-containing enzyme
MESVIKTTTSICPECHQLISADYIEADDGQVYMVKECKDHGKFKDLISINAKHFRWIQQFTFDSDSKTKNPQVPHKIKGCPLDCGICSFHKNSPAIALVDVTYRCNLKCPICYAAALNEKGKNIEPSLEDIRKIYQHFRDIEQPPVCAMNVGGEPTVRDDLPEILAMTKEIGYIQRQVASNGIRFAKDIDFLQTCIDAGMNAIYFQFDGVGSEVYKKTRGADIWALKQKLIENCRELNFHNICLVPTIVKGINDDQIPKIVEYAIQNLDVVSVISFQPVSMCGRIEQQELAKMRITSSHVIDAVNKYTNGETGWMYPMAALAKFSKLASWMSGQPEILELSCHSDCGFGTFLFVDPKTGKMRDITKLFDTPRFIRLSNKWYDKMLKARQSPRPKFRDLAIGPFGRIFGDVIDKGAETLTKAQFVAELMTTFKNPLQDGVDNFVKRAHLFLDAMLNSSRDASANWLIKGNNLLIALMHFQDGYNMDIERTSHCLVHYGYIDPKTKQVMAIPFCPMNTIHRPRIENELLMANAVTKEEKTEAPVPEMQL